jgi:hypothetical protein
MALIVENLFVYSKSEYTLESVSVSGRPFTRQLFTITFVWAEIWCTELSHQYLGQVRRWKWSVKKWLSYRKNCDYWPDHPWGGIQGFFKNKIFLRIVHNIYKSTQFLTLIPNLILNTERMSMQIGNCWFVCPHFYWSKKSTNQKRTLLF